VFFRLELELGRDAAGLGVTATAGCGVEVEIVGRLWRVCAAEAAVWSSHSSLSMNSRFTESSE
jgi:hypothetical protein